MPIFKRFQQQWSDIDKSVYETGLNDKLVSGQLYDKKDDILSFILNQLTVFRYFYYVKNSIFILQSLFMILFSLNITGVPSQR